MRRKPCIFLRMDVMFVYFMLGRGWNSHRDVVLSLPGNMPAVEKDVFECLPSHETCYGVTSILKVGYNVKPYCVVQVNLNSGMQLCHIHCRSGLSTLNQLQAAHLSARSISGRMDQN